MTEDQRTYLAELLESSPRQTFVLFPLSALLVEWLRRGGRAPRLRLRFAPLLLWGFLQYWLTGRYRRLMNAGGPGFKNLPSRLLTGGPYALSRNPMYLGHLLFALGLALTLPSWVTKLMLIERCVRFQRRVGLDEARLRVEFGDAYEAYLRTVRRWIPGIL